MKQIDVAYAILSDDISDAARAVSEAVGVQLKPDRGKPYGDHYRSVEDDKERGLGTYFLYWNWSEDFEEWRWYAYRRYALLHDVIKLEPERSKVVEAALSSVDHSAGSY